MSALRGGDDSVIHMLVPGFRVEELPVTLPNQNNLRFAPDGQDAPFEFHRSKS